MQTHPYADGGARSRADRARRIGVALFKVVGRSPRPRQPGATGSNAYCLAQRCTTGSKSLVPLPRSRAASLARVRLMELARRHAQRLDHVVASCSSILTFTTRPLLLGTFVETIEYRRIKYCRQPATGGTSNYWEPEVYETPVRDLQLTKWKGMLAFSPSLLIVTRLDKASLTFDRMKSVFPFYPQLNHNRTGILSYSRVVIFKAFFSCAKSSTHELPNG